MNTNRLPSRLLWCAALLVVLVGCQTTEDLTTRRQLMHQVVSGPIRVFTTDSTLYALTQYELKGNILKGVGTATKNSITSPYRGELWLSQIMYAQARNPSFFKTLLAVGAIGFMGYSVADAMHAPSGSSVYVSIGFYDPTYYGGGGGGGGGGGSCPFVYSWDGKAYRLEGEAFSVALGRGLEFASHHVLRHMRAESGNLRLQIANRRPETHYLNSVRMLRIDAPPGCEVLSDPRGAFWPISATSPLRTGVDRSGRDVAASLAQADELYWESDGAGTMPGGDYEDRIEVTFDRPPQRGDGTLVVRAINTHLSEAVYAYLGEFLGDQALPFVQRLENDPELLARLRAWIMETSLKIEIWDGSCWVMCDRILPEANELAFAHAVRIQVPESSGPLLRLRLRALADVWKIDEVAIDWTPAAPLRTADVPMTEAVGPEGVSVAGPLGQDDQRYVTLLPPERVELRFTDAVTPPKEGRTVYAARVGGYLHEWLAEPPADPSGILSGEARLALVQQIIGRKEVLLPPVYAAWNAMKAGGR